MGVRLGLVPLAFQLPALARATASLVVGISVAFAVAFPFITTLALLTWRRLWHPSSPIRFEPRATRKATASGSETPAEGDETAVEGKGDDAVIRRVAVIGGGAAGLVTLRQMLDKGMDAVLFERSGDIGGLWAYDNEETSKVFNSVTQNVTKLHNRFAGYPAPQHWPLYLGHAHTLEYLKGYARRYGLTSRIRLRREVMSCERNAEGKFEVKVRNTGEHALAHQSKEVSSTETVATGGIASLFAKLPTSLRRDEGDVATEVFDAVCVCSGQLSKPNNPGFPGMENFPGRVIHTSQYRVPSDMAGERVLIVGTGAASGSDIAQDLAGVASSVVVSVRTERWILHRGVCLGQPTTLLRAATWLPVWLGALLSLYADWIPFFRRLEPGMTDSKDFLSAVALGKIDVAKTVAKVSGSTVTFADGRAQEFDTIVLATGFQREVPFMPSALSPDLGLYKGVFVPSEPRVAYILFVLPFGSHFQIAELQATWVARVFAGDLGTPSVPDMIKHARLMPATASHEKLGEFHRMQYVAMLQPSILRDALCMFTRDPVRLFRILFCSRYIFPVAEWDPKFIAKSDASTFDVDGIDQVIERRDANMGDVKWRGLKFM